MRKSGPITPIWSPKTCSLASLTPPGLLAFKRGCSYEEAKKAYLKKMKEYHPDKVDHLGEELKELALKKAKEITKAWEQLQKDC